MLRVMVVRDGGSEDFGSATDLLNRRLAVPRRI